MNEANEAVNDRDHETKPVAQPFLTARVADSYGVDPHEHKPSQDPWDADTAAEKQAETGGVECPGNSCSTSPGSGQSSPQKHPNESAKPAPDAENRTGQVRTENSSAGSTASGRKGSQAAKPAE